MAASLQDIAERVGVSSASVSLYLNDPETRRVGATTKQKIQDAIDELEYRPNAAARALASTRTRTVAVLIPWNGPIFRSTFVGELLAGIQSVLTPYEYGMLFLPAQGTESRDLAKKQLANGHGHDGYILFGTRYCSYDDMVHNVELMLRAGVPFSVVNMPEVNLPVNQVLLIDPTEGKSTEVFVRNGHRDIVLMVGRESAPESTEEVTAYRKTLSRAGLPFRKEFVVYGDYERTVAHSQMLRLIDSGVSFSAVGCVNDTMAAGVYEALGDRGIRIPDDVSVIGRNDSFFSSLLNPPLSTIRRPVFECGARAAECLLRTIDGAEDVRKIVLKSSFVQRTSISAVVDKIPLVEGGITVL